VLSLNLTAAWYAENSVSGHPYPSVYLLLVPEPAAFEVQLAIYKVERYRSPGTAYILADLSPSGGKNVCAIYLFVLLGIRGGTQWCSD
jgi:hypothetical protein